MDYDRLRELQQKYDENPRRYFAPLANEYRKGGQLKRAIEICRAQLAEMPGHMSGQIVFGQALYEAGEYEEARMVFERAIALDPENLIALRSLGDMSLQAGDSREARSWYTRLLDADPKDTVVITLVTEIDAAADAAPVPMAEEIPGVDSDAGDQEIPMLEPESFSEQHASVTTMESATEPSAGTNLPASPSESFAEPEPAATEAATAPEGLERHYPADDIDSQEDQQVEASSMDGLSQEELGVPSGASAADGLHSMKQDVNAFPWSPPAETSAPEPPTAESVETEEAGDALDQAFADAGAERAEEQTFGNVAAEREEETGIIEAAPAAAEEKAIERGDADQGAEKTFTGASAEPFVNETMAQLYLQQGYKQLALKVYRQLAESRPNDQSLQSRIAEIEAEDAAAHSSEIADARNADSLVERPADRPFPRSPSVDSPAPEPLSASEERPGFDQSPVDSPTPRQPSIREFFATLGRRRPPHQSSPGGGSPTAGNNQRTEPQIPLGATPASASLDTVFAGATVSASDARAASRLAGAFSGASGASRTPPTPPMPTPRVNPRVPQAQESEEDVAKFRAWLDGLTGE
jgi:tetratricopeptide (TPR) repeat protein